MDATLKELAADLPIHHRQITALISIAGIEPCGTRRTGRVGHPWNTYDVAVIRDAYRAETERTSKQFADTDWIASALLGRDCIRADTVNGILTWPDGSRAERLGTGNYGWIHAGGCCVPAHRVIWIAADGEIPMPLQVNHVNKRRWDNRRVNLELVTFGNNIRHAFDGLYVNYHDAVAQLGELEPQSQTINPYGNNFVGGRLICGTQKQHRPGH